MSKSNITLSNIYKDGKCGSQRTIFPKDERKLLATYLPTRGPWFVKFMRISKLRMGVIRKQGLGILVLIIAAHKKLEILSGETVRNHTGQKYCK